VHKTILLAMREKIRTRFYVMTLHAEEEMTNDNLTIFDLEHCILTGQIIERQQDEKSVEWKYLVKGFGLNGESISTVAKISITGKLIFITVFANS
jgi:Domain of unknown function (DUF4258)